MREKEFQGSSDFVFQTLLHLLIRIVVSFQLNGLRFPACARHATCMLHNTCWCCTRELLEYCIRFPMFILQFWLAPCKPPTLCAPCVISNLLSMTSEFYTSAVATDLVHFQWCCHYAAHARETSGMPIQLVPILHMRWTSSRFGYIISLGAISRLRSKLHHAQGKRFMRYWYRCDSWLFGCSDMCVCDHCCI